MTRRVELFIVSAVVLIAACVTFVPLRNEWVLHTKSKTTAAKQNVAKGGSCARGDRSVQQEICGCTSEDGQCRDHEYVGGGWREPVACDCADDWKADDWKIHE